MNAKMLTTALKYYGEKEEKGSQTNWLILKWVKRYIPSVKDDGDYAWCSIFINEIAKECNLEYTDSALARSWLNVGEEVEEPEMGNVVILWRDSKDSQWGHVGLYVKEDSSSIYVLGGNQNNQISIAKYPKSRLLGYRKLNDYGMSDFS